MGWGPLDSHENPMLSHQVVNCKLQNRSWKECHKCPCQVVCRNFPTHRIHGNGIFCLCIYHTNQPNVGKYTTYLGDDFFPFWGKRPISWCYVPKSIVITDLLGENCRLIFRHCNFHHKSGQLSWAARLWPGGKRSREMKAKEKTEQFAALWRFVSKWKKHLLWRWPIFL